MRPGSARKLKRKSPVPLRRRWTTTVRAVPRCPSRNTLTRTVWPATNGVTRPCTTTVSPATTNGELPWRAGRLSCSLPEAGGATGGVLGAVLGAGVLLDGADDGGGALATALAVAGSARIAKLAAAAAAAPDLMRVIL